MSVRREDRPLLAGQAVYTDDLSPARLTHAAIRRSEYPHATIRRIDTDGAERLDGVLGVYTATNLSGSAASDGVPVWFSPPSEDGPEATQRLNRELVTPRRPLLAADTVRYAGEPVALVVAEDRYVAHDAADAIEIDYDRLDAVNDPVSGADPDAPRLHESASDNVAFDWEIGDQATSAFEEAPHVVSLELTNQRVIPSPMEPRGVLAEFDATRDRLSVTMSTQVPHELRTYLSRILDRPENRIRVRAPDVGGGFGQKSKFYPAEALVAWAATQHGRPVKWVATRSEDNASAIHGRGHVTEATLALERDGTFRGLSFHTHADLGAYLSKVTPRIATAAYTSVLSGQYRLPAITGRVTGVFTNATPSDAYRGAGRPQGIYMLERLVRKAADELDVDPVELRRRNLIPADDFPHRTAHGILYDSGAYERALDKALELADYAKLRADPPDDGRLHGIGIACFVQENGIPKVEGSTVRLSPAGSITAFCGTTDQGQGHTTTYSTLLADRFGVSADEIEIREGDTDYLSRGAGTYASRSMIAEGGSLHESAGKVIEKARRIAAHRFETAPADIEFENGEFFVTGSPDRSVTLAEVSAAASSRDALPEGMEPGLEATTFYQPEHSLFSFGTHVAMVAVDPETGAVTLRRYIAVDDCGTQLSPTQVEGQVHGGIVQGIGQALYEEAVYDETGALITASLQDYAMPKAFHVPDIEVAFTETPSPFHPLGVKGVGESGTLGPPPAIVNAVVDALPASDVDGLEMPLTPERVWRQLQD